MKCKKVGKMSNFRDFLPIVSYIKPPEKIQGSENKVRFNQFGKLASAGMRI